MYIAVSMANQTLIRITSADSSANSSASSPEFARSVPEAVLATAANQPERVALVVADSRIEVSYGQMADRIQAVAGGLRQLGVKPNDRVALLGENRPEWAIAYLGIQAAGGTVLPLDVLLKAEEHERLLTVGGPKALIVSQKFYGQLHETLKERFADLPLILFDSCNDECQGQTSLEELYRAEPFLCETVETKQAASLIFTSGSTGTPKAVVLTHGNLLSNIRGIFAGLHFNEEDTFLSLLPLSHVYESTTGFLTPLIAGGRIVYARSLAAAQVVEDLRNHEITVLIGVPLLFEKMARGMQRKLEKAPSLQRKLFALFYHLARFGGKLGINAGRRLFASLRAKAGMSTLRMMVSGGAPLDPAIAEFYATLGFCFLQGYGMTECSPVISVNLPESNRIGSVGPALPGIEIRIDKPNAEGIGEIIVAGASVTPGYLDDEEKTKSVIRDGWLHTGDLGKLEDGFLHICGRAKNLIVSAGGKNIYPEEIELTLQEHDYVLEALILGRKTEGKQGERVCALLYPDIERIKELHPDMTDLSPGSESIRPLLERAVNETNTRMADFKRIAEWEIQAVEFEKTSSRKIKRALYE